MDTSYQKEKIMITYNRKTTKNSMIMNQQEPVKRLSEQLTKNGIRYQLKKRTESVAMYEQLASYSDTVLAIEVFKIKVMPPNKFVSTPYEKFPSNEDIGKAMGAKSFGGYSKNKLAEEYFNELEKGCLEGGVQHLYTAAPLGNKIGKAGAVGSRKTA